MADLAIAWDAAAGRVDWRLGPGGDETDLETAVVLSLFTDRLAPADAEIPDGTAWRRGWWGDGRTEVERRGSLLWLFARRKRLPAVLAEAVAIAEAALAWLVEDGIAATIAVAAEWQGTDTLALAVTVTRPDGRRWQRRYDQVWPAPESP